MKNHLLKLSILAAVCMVGCSADIVVIDTDKDGYPDTADGCPFDPLKVTPGTCGCGYQEEINRSVIPYTISCRSQLSDADGDGVPDIFDQCPDDPLKFEPGDCGCGEYDYRDYQNEFRCILATDRDGDGVPDEIDQCPDDRYKAEPKACGCGLYEVLNASSLEKCIYSPDTDQDGMPDFFDDCPLNPYVIERNQACTCDELPYAEGDKVTCMPFTNTRFDLCPDDPNKVAPGQCGCGVADEDRDMDGRLDCEQINDGDLCEDDPYKTNPGICGCGWPDVYTMSPLMPNCLFEDPCPRDPDKFLPGVCGCGVPDTDEDQNGIPDCVDKMFGDRCPDDPVKDHPGYCGCGVPDEDRDGDGIMDCMEECPKHPESTLATDWDCDGVPNNDDACPYNPNRQTSDEQYGCLDVADSTYTVYSAKDFDTLSKLLDKPVFAPHARKDRETSIRLARDLNLADFFLKNGEENDGIPVLEFRDIAVTPDCSDDDPACEHTTICSVNPDLPDLRNPVLASLYNAYLGSDDENTARRLYFTARAPETDEEVRCNLPHALLGIVQKADIHNLILDFDLDGENVRASLANVVYDSTIEDVVFTGTFSSTFDDWRTCEGGDGRCMPLGGLIAEIHSFDDTEPSKIIRSGCKNAVLDASHVQYFGGLAGLIENTVVDNRDFEHRIKQLTFYKNSAGVAWRIDNSEINGFNNLIKFIEINYEATSDYNSSAGFVVESFSSEYTGIKNHLYDVKNYYGRDITFAGFAYMFSDGSVTNLENRVDAFENVSSASYLAKFAGAFWEVFSNEEEKLRLTNIKNTINIQNAENFNHFYGFLYSSSGDWPIQITNLYNDVSYYGNKPQYKLSGLFGNQWSLELKNIYSIARMNVVMEGYTYITPWYKNMFFAEYSPEYEAATPDIDHVYFFIPSDVSEDEEISIGSDVISEDILEMPSYAPFKEARVSEKDTEKIIENLNKNVGDTGIKWEQVWSQTYFKVPGFELH